MALRITQPTLCWKPNTVRIRTGRNPSLLEIETMEILAKRLRSRLMHERDSRKQIEPTSLPYGFVLQCLKEIADPCILILTGVTKRKDQATKARFKRK